MSNFWDLIWLIVSAFFLVAYLLVLFQIVGDLLRDPELGGLAKAVWIIALLLMPFLAALVYLVARGKGMSQRQLDALRHAKADADRYIREVAGHSPAEQIAHAKKLLDDGTITPDEFARLKSKAIG